MTMSGLGDILAFAKGVALLILSSVLASIAVDILYLHPDTIAAMIDRMQTIEVGSTKIAFGDMAYAINPDLKLSLSQQISIRESLKSLSPNEFDRLMHLTEYDRDHLNEDDLHCDFDKATSRMRLFGAADAGLIEKKLVEKISTSRLPVVNYNPKDKGAVDIGNPSNCYHMVLTNDGRNLKSVLVSELTRAFGNMSENSVANSTTVPKTATAHKQPRESRPSAREQKAAYLQ